MRRCGRLFSMLLGAVVLACGAPALAAELVRRRSRQAAADRRLQHHRRRGRRRAHAVGADHRLRLPRQLGRKHVRHRHRAARLRLQLRRCRRRHPRSRRAVFQPADARCHRRRAGRDLGVAGRDRREAAHLRRRRVRAGLVGAAGGDRRSGEAQPRHSRRQRGSARRISSASFSSARATRTTSTTTRAPPRSGWRKACWSTRRCATRAPISSDCSDSAAIATTMRRFAAEGTLAYLLRRKIAVGVEYRARGRNLGSRRRKRSVGRVRCLDAESPRLDRRGVRQPRQHRRAAYGAVRGPGRRLPVRASGLLKETVMTLRK